MNIIYKQIIFIYILQLTVLYICVFSDIFFLNNKNMLTTIILPLHFTGIHIIIFI